jgi:hypothetical protein
MKRKDLIAFVLVVIFVIASRQFLKIKRIGGVSIALFLAI